jgi:hypothetical protein
MRFEKTALLSRPICSRQSKKMSEIEVIPSQFLYQTLSEYIGKHRGSSQKPR